MGKCDSRKTLVFLVDFILVITVARNQPQSHRGDTVSFRKERVAGMAFTT